MRLRRVSKIKCDLRENLRTIIQDKRGFPRNSCYVTSVNKAHVRKCLKKNQNKENNFFVLFFELNNLARVE